MKRWLWRGRLWLWRRVLGAIPSCRLWERLMWDGGWRLRVWPRTIVSDEEIQDTL